VALPSEECGVVEAYEDALRALGLRDRDDPATEIVAKKTGHAHRLSALAIEQLGILVLISK
jgi:hypothetical protein